VFSNSCVVTCGRAEMAKLIGAVLQFLTVNLAKISSRSHSFFDGRIMKRV
jgi:hypothetical protein